MDDLFQSLASAGHMNPTRDRAPTNRSGADGTAFGAAFQSALATTQRKDTATPPMGPPKPALPQDGSGETGTDDIRVPGDIADLTAQDQIGPQPIPLDTAQPNIVRMAFRFEPAAPGSQDVPGSAWIGDHRKPDPAVGAPLVLPAPTPAGDAGETMRSTASSLPGLPENIGPSTRLAKGSGSEVPLPPQEPNTVLSADARKRPDAPDGRPLILPAPFQQTNPTAAGDRSGQHLPGGDRSAIAPLPSPAPGLGAASLIERRAAPSIPGTVNQTGPTPISTPPVGPSAGAVLRSDLGHDQTARSAAILRSLAPDPSTPPTGRGAGVAQAAGASAQTVASPIPGSVSAAVAPAPTGVSLLPLAPEDRSPRVPPSQVDQHPLRTGSWTIPATVQAPFSATPAAWSSNLATAITPTESLAGIPLGSDLGPDLGLGPTVSVSTSALHAPTALIGHSPPHMAQAAAQQIAAALADPARDKGAPLELALDPPELGRVRLQISELAGIMTLTIHAERPETAELMRRHLDLLAQEFAQSGLDAPSVRISQDGSEGGSNAHPRNHSSAASPTISPPEAVEILKPTGRTSSGGLDLRL